jgi:O-antigen ligase
MTAMVSRLDDIVLLGLGLLILGVPLLLGGMLESTVTLAMPVVLLLLAVTVWQRVRLGVRTAAPGVTALAAFALLALASTLPLPPAILGLVAPSTTELYRSMLPGWPEAGGWTAWRAVAIDPYAAWIELLRFAIGFGMFAIIVAYPWQDRPTGEDGRSRAFRVLFLTMVGCGLVFAAIAFMQEAAGNGQVLWVWPAEASEGRLAGPFVNPNHFAGWLEMILPAVLAYGFTVANRVRQRLVEGAHSGRVVGVQSKRAWAASLIANQGGLWPPLVAATVAVVLLAAHLASDSRGGRAALLAGVVVAGLGVLASRGSKSVRLLVRNHAWLLVGGLLVVTTGSFVLLSGAAGDVAQDSVAQDVDVDMGMRLAVAARGVPVFTDHLLFGTGLGSWIHAFRPYQEPPVEDGIWDHAHNDYLELAAETGLVGLAVVILFAVSVARGMQRQRTDPDERPRRHRMFGPEGFEESDWKAALRDTALLRWGLAGGVLAILVHSFVDFGLRMPANLSALMVVVGLLVLSGTPIPAGRRSLAPSLLLVVLLLACVGPTVNAFHATLGIDPLSTELALEQSDALLSEEDDGPGAAAMARVAIDRSPANRDAHEMLAEALGAGDEGDAAMRRAVALEPWAPELRDQLALRLWDRGLRDDALRELEESMFRYPTLGTHAYLDPESDMFPPANSEQLVRELVEGETLGARLAMIDDAMAAAIERGLRRALEAHPGGDMHGAIAQDVVTLLEARGRWREAADTLRTQGELSMDDTDLLARAARNYIKADDATAAEKTLLTAITRTPEQGVLYRRLAVDVYARRGDFAMADTILDAGERNAIDLVPVYRGVTEVLAKRETTRPGIVPSAHHIDDSEGDAEDE